MPPTQQETQQETQQMARLLDVSRCRALGTLVLLALPVLASCRGDRLLLIESVPPGATVRLDDKVIGRTPLEIDFENYGQRRLSLYKETYRTYSEPLVIRAPWWARFPVDLLTEVLLPLGLDDVRSERIVLVPDAGEVVATVATQEFIDHALRARKGDELQGVPLAGESPVDADAEAAVVDGP
ncbi:PEGA domain protein [Planctomycetes bacterium Poly30]|uniref:PEGA domain protein n=2 Tax=Saltatorellus ferox TaxID=2528018 RepID=A0A518EXE3_9BACT|nr:PEGA domain protein [Planctomycetes bacterium Poly30]